MSTADRFTFTVAVLFLWILTLGIVGVVLHGFEAVPTAYPFVLTISLMALGGALCLLSMAFVNYFGGIEFRLF